MNAPPSSDNVTRLVEAGCLPEDPLPWILASAEPSARLVALTRLTDLPAENPAVVAARVAVVADPAVRELIAELPAWDVNASVSDHHSPLFAPNRLGLLADLGVRSGDDPRLDALLDAMLASRDRHGRFVVPEALAARPKPERGAVTCDSNAIADVLVRLGRGDDPRVVAAIKRLAGDSANSPQGRGWRCLPERRPLFEFGAARNDACPQVTLEGVRALGHLPAERRPAFAADGARTLLAFWRRRAEQRPYDFGHGYQFKTVKWPSFWYDALAVLDAVSRYPQVWEPPGADPADRVAVAELAAALIAHNVGPTGRVAPGRTYRGFERFSFGRRGEESPYATARVLAVLSRLAGLADDIAAVDVDALPPSAPIPTRTAEQSRTATAACPVPQRRVAYEPARVLPRVLGRHHLGTPWESASIESLASDIVGFTAAHPATPYLSLAARLPGFDPVALDRALDEHGSLVRIRCMRGMLYQVRRDLVPVVHAASTRQVTRYARDFVKSRGITPAEYESLSARVLAACADEPLTTAELRERLRPGVDLAAVVTLMTAEATLARCAPRDGRFGHATTFAPFEVTYPDIALGRVSEDDARATLLRAYVRGFGPVTARDAAWWTGMDLKRVRRAFDSLEDELVEIELRAEEGRWLMHAADAEELERASFGGEPVVTLLPALDPLVMSYTDRSRFVDDAARPYVFDAARHVAPVVVVDGRIAGVWDVHAGGSGLDAQPQTLVHLFAEQPAGVRALVEAAGRRAAEVRLGRAAGVTFVRAQTPLSDRAIGAYTHPLH